MQSLEMHIDQSWQRPNRRHGLKQEGRLYCLSLLSSRAWVEGPRGGFQNRQGMGLHPLYAVLATDYVRHTIEEH